MPLADCVVATSTETIDPTLSAGTVTLSASQIASGQALVAALNAAWLPVSNPYFQGIQFDYGVSDGTSGRIVTAAQRQSPFTTPSGIVGGQTYTVRYRAAGIAPVFGPWSSYVTLAIPVAHAPAPPQPGATVWSAVGTTISGGGTSFPAIHVSGALELTTGVTEIVVEFAPHGTTGWATFGDLPINTTGVDVTAVGATALYDIAISYGNLGSIGPRRVLNNGGAGYAAGGFVGSGGATNKTPTAITWPNVTASGAGTQTGTMTAQTIAGINVPITLALTFTGSGTWTYTKNGATFAFVSGDTVVVSVGDTLGFNPSADATTSGTLTVTNQTDSNAVVGTPTYSLTVTSTTVTISPVTWADISEVGYGSHPTSGFNLPQTIAGNNVACTLNLSYTGAGVSIYYNKNSFGPVFFSSGTTISVRNGDTLSFKAYKTGLGTGSGVVTVQNSSDSSATVGSFNYSITIQSGQAP